MKLKSDPHIDYVRIRCADLMRTHRGELSPLSAPIFGSSGMWCLRMWCLIIIGTYINNSKYVKVNITIVKPKVRPILIIKHHILKHHILELPIYYKLCARDPSRGSRSGFVTTCIIINIIIIMTVVVIITSYVLYCFTGC